MILCGELENFLPSTAANTGRCSNINAFFSMFVTESKSKNFFFICNILVSHEMMWKRKEQEKILNKILPVHYVSGRNNHEIMLLLLSFLRLNMRSLTHFLRGSRRNLNLELSKTRRKNLFEGQFNRAR